MSEFYRYFKENMEALGLPAPESLFGSVTMAVESAGLIHDGPPIRPGKAVAGIYLAAVACHL